MSTDTHRRLDVGPEQPRQERRAIRRAMPPQAPEVDDELGHIVVGVGQRDEPLLVEPGRVRILRLTPQSQTARPSGSRSPCSPVVAHRCGRPGDAALIPMPTVCAGSSNSVMTASTPSRVRTLIPRPGRGPRGYTPVHGAGRRHDQRVAVIGAEVSHPAVDDDLHDLPAPTEGRKRQTTADALGQRDEVRLDAEALGGRRHIRRSGRSSPRRR